jgi:hypothetical protein
VNSVAFFSRYSKILSIERGMMPACGDRAKSPSIVYVLPVPVCVCPTTRACERDRSRHGPPSRTHAHAHAGHHRTCPYANTVQLKPVRTSSMMGRTCRGRRRGGDCHCASTHRTAHATHRLIEQLLLGRVLPVHTVKGEGLGAALAAQVLRHAQLAGRRVATDNRGRPLCLLFIIEGPARASASGDMSRTPAHSHNFAPTRSRTHLQRRTTCTFTEGSTHADIADSNAPSTAGTRDPGTHVRLASQCQCRPATPIRTRNLP